MKQLKKLLGILLLVLEIACTVLSQTTDEAIQNNVNVNGDHNIVVINITVSSDE